MMTSPLDNVSRETIAKLEDFAALVQKWTVKINLVSKSSSEDLWNRHVLDSAQLFELAPRKGRWVDLGSGGGFPSIVVAILAQGAGTDHAITLVESDQRKAVFLRTAIRELALDAKVLSERIENLPPLKADILSARALTDLAGLFGFADLHLDAKGLALFPKGAQWEKELKSAQEQWQCSYDVIKSKSNPEAAILKIKDIVRV
ncbi:16S rRNA (guanine(527)-N(7))-methyltransferase RsmG [Sulfitobacter geojensis]|uniref:16S rRNA (guanine(527)-N(7))-methyltransferase RsmG n=1 Tax=Sulfitobacter geojensis TaxID=1342299 RepID=UPI0007D9E8CE|nr:16S rRNA (guanine(527)-N(7))-methyltransferase RsmG [Sulfitobacter geojensis]OAN84837.1 16S rRNA (guanine(527)-N(7))-methyltransferase RsmG [Sulfitobacter geojensis]